MAQFRFCFIVEIREETKDATSLRITDSSNLAFLISSLDSKMSAADEKCNELMAELHSRYFPEVKMSADGSGYSLSDRIRENFYIITMTDINTAKAFLEKIDKILYDFRDSDKIRIGGNPAYMDRKFFAKKVTDFSRDLVAYDLLKNLDL